MSRSHRLAVAALIGIVGVGLSCAPQPPAKPANSIVPPNAPVPDTDAPTQHRAADPSDMASDPSVEALAERARAYAKSMESAMARRSATEPDRQALNAATLLHDPESALHAIGGSSTREMHTAPQSAAPKQLPVAPISEPEPIPAAAVIDKTSPTETPIVQSEPPVQLEPADEGAAIADPLEKKVDEQVKQYPDDVSAHLNRQLLKFIREERVPQMSDLNGLPAEDREILSALLDGLTNYRNGLRRDQNMLLANKVQPLIEIGERLRSRAELHIPTLVLCRKVERFGVYEPIEPEFEAGQAHKALVYCEIENFSSQLNDRQIWETKLKRDLVLYHETGLQIWPSNNKTVTDLSRNRRRDFHIYNLITLPANLSIGRYVLKMTIEDENANRIAEATLPIKIVAKTAKPAASK